MAHACFCPWLFSFVATARNAQLAMQQTGNASQATLTEALARRNHANLSNQTIYLKPNGKNGGYPPTKNGDTRSLFISLA
jgi:hypothetical protein